jgi:hypothetical protein
MFSLWQVVVVAVHMWVQVVARVGCAHLAHTRFLPLK